MIFITTKTWQDNDVEAIPVDKVKWLNEKKHKKKLGHSNLTMMTAMIKEKKDKNYNIVANISLPEYL